MLTCACRIVNKPEQDKKKKEKQPKQNTKTKKACQETRRSRCT